MATLVIGRPSCVRQESGARSVAGHAGRDTYGVVAILRGGELGPERDFPESKDRGLPATAVISEVCTAALEVECCRLADQLAEQVGQESTHEGRAVAKSSLLFASFRACLPWRPAARLTCRPCCHLLERN